MKVDSTQTGPSETCDKNIPNVIENIRDDLCNILIYIKEIKTN